MPTNTSFYLRVLLHPGSPEEVPILELTRLEDGALIPLTPERYEGDDAAHLFFSPEADLEAGADHHLVVYYSERQDYPYGEYTFTTADGPDDGAPAALPPLASEGVFHRGYKAGMCGWQPARAYALLHLEPPEAQGGDLIEIQAATRRDMTGAITTFDWETTVGVGHPQAHRGQRLFIRARAVDLAGNAGPWTEVEEARIPLCAMADNAPSGALGFALIALATFLGGRPRRRPSLSLLSLLPLGAFLLPTPGQACEATPVNVENVVVDTSAGEAATNTRFLLEIYSGADLEPGLELRPLAGGDELPLEVREIRSPDQIYWWVAPAQELEANTDYILRVYYQPSREAFYSEERIATGDGPDGEAPEGVPSFSVEGIFRRAGRNDPCGTQEDISYVSIQAGSPQEQGGDVYEVEIATDRTMADAVTYFDKNGSISLSHPDLERRGQAFVRMRTLDFAGNAGPWTEVEEARIPLCAMADNAPSGALGFALIALAAFLGGVPRRRPGA